MRLRKTWEETHLEESGCQAYVLKRSLEGLGVESGEENLRSGKAHSPAADRYGMREGGCQQGRRKLTQGPTPQILLALLPQMPENVFSPYADLSPSHTL